MITSNFNNLEAYLTALRRRECEPRVLDYEFVEPPPFDHQVRMFEWGRRFQRSAILAEQGTGKTKVAIDIVQYRLERHKIKNVLIVCPLSVISSWQDEIKKWIKPQFKRPVRKLIGYKKNRIDELKRGLAVGSIFFIVNYDGARVIAKELAAAKFDMIVLDESIMIKNRTALRTKCLIEISENIKYRLIMTGSPITQSPLDLWSQYYFLDRGHTLGSNFYRYRGRYFYEHRLGKFSKWVPRKWAFDEIKKLVYKTSIRFTKEQCLDLPDKIFQKREIEMSIKQKALYKQMADNLVAEIERDVYTSASVIVVKMLRLSQITAGIVQPDDAEEAVPIEKNDPKNKEILSLLEQTDNLVVVWCRFRKEITMTRDFLQSKGYKCGIIYGDIKQEIRARNIDRWRKGLDRVIICQVGTAGMGITLLPEDPSVGITVIYRTNDYSLNNRLQSQDRTHRIGLKKPVTYIDLVCPKTIDVSVLNSLTSKKDMADSVLEQNIRAIVKGGVK